MGGTKVTQTQSLSWLADTAAADVDSEGTVSQALSHMCTSRVMCMDAYDMYGPRCSPAGFIDLGDTGDSHHSPVLVVLERSLHQNSKSGGHRLPKNTNPTRADWPAQTPKSGFYSIMGESSVTRP